MGRGAYGVKVSGGKSILGRRLFELARQSLHPQDSPHGIVHARLRDLAQADLLEKVSVELFPTVGRHVHVETRVQGLGTGELRATGNLLVRVPVADYEARKIPSVLQHVGQQ